MSKKKWLLIVLAVLLAIAAVIFIFWDIIAIYVMPKSVLSKALSEAIADIQSRYEKSPVSMIGRNIDPNGQYTARMKLETEQEILGQVDYDMTVQADTFENRIQGTGMITTSQNDLDLSFYMDRDFMALSSEDLLGGAYYGITYDSFSEDIRSIPLISMFVGEKILSGWDSSVFSIQKMMNQSYRLPDMPEFSGEDIQRAMMAVMLLPSKVTPVEMPVWGVYVKGYRIDYSAKGEQVGEVLGYLMDTGDGSDAQLTASFYLYENQLVMMQLQGEAGGNSIQCAVEFIFSAVTRTFRFSRNEQGVEEGFCLSHKAESGNSGYLDETWTFYPNFEAEGEGETLSYRWEPVMGEMIIRAKPSITLNIFETEAGLNIQTDHFEQLMAALSGRDPDGEAVSCKLTLQKGNEIATPAYKNIREWSLEDLLVLLGGVGSLIGLEV